MPNEAKPKPKKRNQFMQIAQQAAESAQKQREREESRLISALADKGDTKSFFAGFCTNPQMA